MEAGMGMGMTARQTSPRNENTIMRVICFKYCKEISPFHFSALYRPAGGTVKIFPGRNFLAVNLDIFPFFLYNEQ